MADLTFLLSRGDEVAIIKGKLFIKAASGKPVPSSWLADNSASLLEQILSLTGEEGFLYESFTTGYYPHAGVCLQFDWLNHSEGAYGIFNVSLKRKRTTKNGRKGMDRPSKEFSAGRRSDFVRFWRDTGLRIPKGDRYSIFHEYMGNLKGIVFTATVGEKTRIATQTLTLLSVSYDTLKNAADQRISSDNQRTNDKQHTDNLRTSFTDKGIPQHYINRGFQPCLTTGSLSAVKR